MTSFSERQHFRQWWLWGILGLSVAFYVGSVWQRATPLKPGDWVGLSLLLSIIVLIYIWRLDTRIDATGIHYRVFPILPWRTISWFSVKSATLTRYSFVGYGIRIGWEGWVYNIAGNRGVRIERTNKDVIIIGTQQPDELQAWLDQHMEVSQ